MTIKNPEVEIFDPEKTWALVDGARALLLRTGTKLASISLELHEANEGMKYEQTIRGMSTDMPELE